MRKLGIGANLSAEFLSPIRRQVVPRNVETKARARDFAKQCMLAESLGDGDTEHLVQEDTFFCVPTGRLKLRVFADGSGELIQYQRTDSKEPSESQYVRAPTNDPQALKVALANALGIRRVVKKKRTVYFVGQTRIHLDRVENLGEFIELEVVLTPEQPFSHGTRVAAELMEKLQIEDRDLIDCAYVDLFEEEASRRMNGDKCIEGRR